MLLQVHRIIATFMVLKLNGPRSTEVGQTQSDPVGDVCKSPGAPRHEVGPWEQNKAIIWTKAASKPPFANRLVSLFPLGKRQAIGSPLCC